MGIYVRPDASDWIVDKDARTGLIDRQKGRLIWQGQSPIATAVSEIKANA